MKLLRETIRKLILEVYELSPEDKISREDWNEEFEISHGTSFNKDMQRAFGLQDEEDIHSERMTLGNYQQELKKHPDGERMIRDFMSGKGNITVVHGIDYGGTASGAGVKTRRDTNPKQSAPFTQWLKTFKNNKDQLSTVSWTQPMGKEPKGVDLSWMLNNERVLKGIGFFMKGYPVYVSDTDEMTQTLGALPPGLIDHQKHSGVAKRANPKTSGGNALYGFDWDFSQETILDNWTPIGIFIGMNHMQTEYGYDMIVDAISTKLPVYAISRSNFELIDPADYEDDYV